MSIFVYDETVCGLGKAHVSHSERNPVLKTDQSQRPTSKAARSIFAQDCEKIFALNIFKMAASYEK